MHQIGDLVVYSTHGVCEIDEICDKTYGDITAQYYILHPIYNNNLSIQSPVNTTKAGLSLLISEEGALAVLESFKGEGVAWIDNTNHRMKAYNDIVKSGDRLEISKVINTLLRKQHELLAIDRKFSIQDNKMLTSIQGMLYPELSITLKTDSEEIAATVLERLALSSQTA